MESRRYHVYLTLHGFLYTISSLSINSFIILQEQIERAKRERQISLTERKHQLSQLYNEEMKNWREEVLSKVETVEERKARIMERAYKLRDAREAARGQYVEECYNRRWREACDDARTLDSLETTKFMAAERMRQIQDKIQRKQNLNSDEGAWLDEWKRQLDLIEAKDQAKKDFRKRCDMETQAGIMAQIEYNNRKKQEHYNRTQDEDEDEIRRIRGAIAEDEAKQKDRADKARQAGIEVKEFNKQFKIIEEENARVEREQNAILLEYALRKEREQIEFEEAQKNAYKNAAMQYRKYLEEQMVKEAEDNSFVEEINKRESEKVWKARDDALQAREDARKYLMKLVDEGRQEQLRFKKQQEDSAREHDKVYVKKFIEDAVEGIEMEKRALQRRRELAEKNNVELMSQIEARRQAELVARQEVYLEDKAMKHMEKLHQQKLAEQGGSVKEYFPLQKNNWYT